MGLPITNGLGSRKPTETSEKLHREITRMLIVTERLGRQLTSHQATWTEKTLPDDDWLGTYKEYSNTLKWCMAEERLRHVALLNSNDVDREFDYEKESESLVGIVSLLTDAELRKALQGRKASVFAGLVSAAAIP
jgi:hypothetical protein